MEQVRLECRPDPKTQNWRLLVVTQNRIRCCRTCDRSRGLRQGRTGRQARPHSAREGQHTRRVHDSGRQGGKASPHQRRLRGGETSAAGFRRTSSIKNALRLEGIFLREADFYLPAFAGRAGFLAGSTSPAAAPAALASSTLAKLTSFPRCFSMWMMPTLSVALR